MSKSTPLQQLAPPTGTVIWLDKRKPRLHRGARPSTPAMQPERLRRLLTAVAGLDALEVELLGVHPSLQGAMVRHLAESRKAAAASRRALHRACPVLSALEPLEILHVMDAVRATPVDPEARPGRRSRMTFGPLEPPSIRRFRWGCAAFAILLASIQCLALVADLL